MDKRLQPSIRLLLAFPVSAALQHFDALMFTMRVSHHCSVLNLGQGTAACKHAVLLGHTHS